MSSQRGNINRARGQKHQNRTAFKNTLHDKSKRTKMINNMEIAEVCKRCQDVIAWKIKYKKYKPLSQPKTCTKCHQKTIKDAYHVVCMTCAKDLDVCCKCGKKEEIVTHKSPTKLEQLQTMAQLEMEVKSLSERRRRAYYRYIDKLQGRKKKKKAEQPPCNSPGTEGMGGENDEKEGENDEEPTSLSFEEYFKNAQQKLEELQKGMDGNCDLIDDFEDLSISSDEDDDDDYDDDDDDC